MAEELPKEELLRKMLNMTTSDNDGQALVAIRKANALLEAAGWSWDKLLAGKIRIVESPFKNMPNPTRKQERVEPAPASAPWQQPMPIRPPRPRQAPRAGCEWRYDTSIDDWVNVQVRTPQQATSRVRGLGLTRSNMYASHCYCCGDYVSNNDGFIMKPKDFNFSAPDKWAIVCKDCNTHRSAASVAPRPAMKNTGQTTVKNPSLGEL